MNKVVFIRESVTEDVANNMIALTLYLDSLDKKRIYYWLNCPGGDVSMLLSAELQGFAALNCSMCQLLRICLWAASAVSSQHMHMLLVADSGRPTAIGSSYVISGFQPGQLF